MMPETALADFFVGARSVESTHRSFDGLRRHAVSLILALATSPDRVARDMGVKPLFAIVLAAGAASRFRASKQLALYDGEPLARRAVRLAESACVEHSVLVTGCDWLRVHDACSPLRGFLVRNEAFDAGMGGSIACGVKAVAETADAVLLLLADQPLITADYLQQLIVAWDGSDTRIVCSEFAGTAGPPVIFPARYFDELVQLEGDKGARALLETHSNQVIGMPCEAAATDIDTPGDLRELSS